MTDLTASPSTWTGIVFVVTILAVLHCTIQWPWPEKLNNCWITGDNDSAGSLNCWITGDNDSAGSLNCWITGDNDSAETHQT